MVTGNKTNYYVPDYFEIERDKFHLLIDYETPNWIVSDKRGSQIIKNIKAGKALEEITFSYANEFNIDLPKAWIEVDSLLNELEKANFASTKPVKKHAYKGRNNHITLDKLNELWIHTNNMCNLTCGHCLVDSSPKADKGLPADKIKLVIDEAIKLGTNRFYFTGGEPFMRNDIFELIDYICVTYKKELIVLTNGTLLKGNNIEKLKSYDKELLKLQISLDGSTGKINDQVRGKGSFEQIIEGIKNIVSIGFLPTVTTAVTNGNINDVESTTELIAGLGVKTHHLLWVHKRGRISVNDPSFFVPIEKLVKVTNRAKSIAGKLGIKVDNLDSYSFRANSVRGTRYDLGNACYDSLCVYSNGDVYPSAAFAGHEELNCGNVFNSSLEDVWKNSPIAKAFRNATLNNKEECVKCHLKFICGGGDIEHSFFYSENGSKVNNDRFNNNTGIHSADPYCSLHEELIYNAIFNLADVRKEMLARKTGFDSPIVIRSMGEGAIDCSMDEEMNKDGSDTEKPKRNVRTLHSNCVLSFDVDKPRRAVRDFYGKAAEQPQEELCCPTKADKLDTDHIPQDVIDRFYGCGSPISMANVEEGETLVDLGSGAGIDCFIAAKKVGSTGKVYGVDMTDQMLAVANENKSIVAGNLGYDAVEFRKGFLEDIPLDDKTVDIITSNCVINLSPDKKTVFGEMWRILKDNGRIVISDIVSEGETPHSMKANKQLWGECISGSLTENEFITYLEQVGFYGLETLKKVFWKEVEGHNFFSVTVRGYKFAKKEGCVYIGQKAIYYGPYKAVVDEEGHLFPRNKEVIICTDTASKLSNMPYANQFTIINPEESKTTEFSCCLPDSKNTSSCC